MIEGLHTRWVGAAGIHERRLTFKRALRIRRGDGRSWPRRWRSTTGTRATTRRTLPGLRAAAGLVARRMPAGEDCRASAARLAQSIEEYLATIRRRRCLRMGACCLTCALRTTR
jgi:hypothetical protein